MVDGDAVIIVNNEINGRAVGKFRALDRLKKGRPAGPGLWRPNLFTSLLSPAALPKACPLTMRLSHERCITPGQRPRILLAFDMIATDSEVVAFIDGNSLRVRSGSWAR